MPPNVFAVVLFAAALHAGWNAIVKGGSNKLLTTVLISASAAILAALALPMLRQPNSASWPFIAGSAVFQILYFFLVARTYHVADMSQTYPLMRGTAPLLVATASSLGLGASLSMGMWIGVCMICLGILSMAWGVRRGDRTGIILALLNAFVIATYTLIDGIGVRRSGAPAGYTLWIFLVTGIPFTVMAVGMRRRSITDYLRLNWYFGLIGGVGTVASYGLALWAMTIAPIAVVAALRETSIVFGAIIAGMLLKEQIGFVRFLAACTIALGAAVLRLA